MKNYWKKRGPDLYYVTRDSESRYYIIQNIDGDRASYSVYDGLNEDRLGITHNHLSAIDIVVRLDDTVTYTIS